MKRNGKIVIIVLVGLVQSSCSFGGQGSESSSMASESQTLSFERSGSESWSIDGSNTLSPTNSTSREIKTYYTVSIYQSFYLPDKDKYGDPRYDIKYKVEAFAPFYKDVDAFRELKSQCHPSLEFNYSHPGGAAVMVGFYYDVTCKREIMYGDPVTANTSIYYYCY